jgi:hypothetical protein
VDIGGRRRARLFAGPATAERTLVWRGLDDGGAPLPAGIYWIRLGEIGPGATPASAHGAPLTRTVRVVLLP